MSSLSLSYPPVDDLEVAPDFFHYMSAGLRLLQQDHTLWCVSAWNDNGKEGLIDQNAAGEYTEVS